jgi:hypothetical protein
MPKINHLVIGLVVAVFGHNAALAQQTAIGAGVTPSARSGSVSKPQWITPWLRSYQI